MYIVTDVKQGTFRYKILFYVIQTIVIVNF